MKKPGKILIIEDNEDLLQSYTYLIDTMPEFEVCGSFSSCELAFEQLEKLQPNVIIMDIDLPGINGIEGTRQVKKMQPKIDILINTVFENSDRVFAALSAGAGGYITKNSGQKELFLALNQILSGGAPMSANIARMVIKSFQKDNQNLLKEKELQVLNSLATGKSYKSIAADNEISIDYVKFHIKNIYEKLEVSSREEAIDLAKNNNWI